MAIGWFPGIAAPLEGQEFEHLFTPVGTVELEDTGDSLRTLRDFQVAPTGEWITTEYYEQGIRVYDPEGKLVRVIPGGMDGNPHSQTTRIAVTSGHIYASCLETDQLTVLDMEGRRVGGPWSPGFTPNEICANETGALWLGGRVFQAGQPGLGYAVHHYDPEFDYQSSMFRRDPRGDTLAGAAISFFGMDLSSNGDLIAVQPLQYGVQRFKPDGALQDSVGWDPQGSAVYKSPFDYEGSASPRAQRDWFRSWTQVLDVHVGDGLIFVVLQTHQPHRYALEVLDEDLQRTGSAVTTDYRLLDMGPRNTLYFLTEKSPHTIGIFRFTP